MTAAPLSDRTLRRVASATAAAMTGALALASLVGFAPPAAAADRRPLAELESTNVAATTATSLLFLARDAQSPCEATTTRYRAAQAALAAGDIEAADDIAVIAQALIAECGWTTTDAALGGK